MLKLGALLTLSSILLAAVHGKTEARFEEKDILENDMPFDFLTFSSGKEIEAMFGFEIIEYIHRERLRCLISHSQVELKFTDRMDTLMLYFKQTQNTVEQLEFEELASENKKDIEENFHKTLKEMEHSRLRKLSSMRSRCDDNIELYMDERLAVIMDYASTMHQAEEAEFSKLLTNMIPYQSQLETGLNSCIDYMERNSEKEHFENAGLFYDLCYGNEVQFLDKLITKFIALARELAGEPDEKDIVLLKLPDVKPDTTKIEVHELPIPEEPKPEIDPEEVNEVPPKIVVEEPRPEPTPDGLEDDEDIEYELSGNGKPEETQTLPPKEIEQKKNRPITAILKKLTEPTREPSPRTESKISPTDSNPTELPKEFETSTKFDSPLTTIDTKLNIANEFLNSLEPGPVIIEEPAFSNIAEDSFEKVKAMQDASNEEDSSQRSRSSSESDTEETGDSGLNIDIELPGIDVEIDESGIKVDAQGVGEGVVIFDKVASTTEAPEHEHHGKHDFKTVFFIYFFATLGVLLAITMLILLIAIVRLRLSKTTSSRKDTPLLSEEDKLAVLKQSGYVNPTYKFFDEVKDV